MFQPVTVAYQHMQLGLIFTTHSVVRRKLVLNRLCSSIYPKKTKQSNFIFALTLGTLSWGKKKKLKSLTLSTILG